MKLKPQFRAMGADSVKIDEAARTVEFSFSSEFPVDRWFGEEILSHDTSAGDFSRLNGGANLLWNHDPDQVIGVIESAEIRGDKRGYALARFSKNDFADQKFRDVVDSIIRNVSFGYCVDEMEMMNPGAQDQEPEYLATKWTPFEVSFVSIPADPTVGVGRAIPDEEREVRVINKRDGVAEESRKMDIETQKAEQAKRDAEIKLAREEAIKAERLRIGAIESLGTKFGKTELARQLIEGQKSIEEARAAFLEQMGAAQRPVSEKDGEIGLSKREIGEFSFVRALQALMNPGDRKFQEAASYEREVSDAAQKVAGKSARGIMVPVDVLRAGIMSGQRGLSVGTASAGGDLVSTNLLASSFIELLRNKSVMQSAGATVLNGLVGNIAIPKATGAATAYWVAESGSPTGSQQALGQVSMNPKTVGAYNDYSRKLLLQSSIDVEAFIRSDLAAVIALEIDRVALYGLGSSSQPQGLKPLLAGGAQESNFAGATPTFAEVIGLESKVTSANADIGAMSYIVNASMKGSLKAAVKVASYPSFIMESDGSMNGYKTQVSNQIASGDVWFGVWSQLIMGFWSGLDLMVDPYTGSTAGTVRVVALQDCDIAARHAEAFARGNDTP